MKLPRWLLIGLWTSIVLAVLASAGWWWVTWPERTAREYVDLLYEHRIADANRMLVPKGRLNGGFVLLPRSENSDSSWKQSDLEEEHSQGWGDLLRARKRFRMASTGYQFTVEWGKVSESRPLFWIEDLDLGELSPLQPKWKELDFVPMEQSQSVTSAASSSELKDIPAQQIP